MSLSFAAHTRDVAIGSVPEADPNTTPPIAAKIFKIGSRDGSGKDTGGHLLVGRFDTEQPTGTAAYQTWFQDSATGQWYKFPADTLTHRVGKVTKAMKVVDIYVQITSFANAGSATKFILSAIEI